jgi:predicted RNase H-like HicB family nuclease
MRYAVVLEKGPTSYGAHMPDLPGCVAVGETAEEVLQLIREAAVLHVQALREENSAIPEPSQIEYIEIPTP